MRVRAGGPGARRRRSAIVVTVLALAAAASLPGCGGGGGSPAGPSGPRRQMIGQGSFTLADSAVAIRQTGGVDYFTVAITMNVAGTLEAVVDWTFASNDLDVYFFRGNCNPTQIRQGACGNPFTQSESVTAKPERLSASGLSAGSYTLVITSNVGNTAESGNFQIFVTG